MKFSNISTILAVMLLGGTQAFAPVSKTPMAIPTTTSTSLNLESLEQKTPDYDKTAELLDTYGEQARIYRRNVFSAADWVKSRRSTRFFDTILSTPQSALIRQVSTEVTFITFAAIFVVLYNDLLISGFDINGVHQDGFMPTLPAMKLPLTPFTLSSGSLGLLLTFRTNVSYSRWNEARTAWGKVINDSRSIARMGCIWSKSYKGIDDGAVQRLGDAICSFSRSLMNRTLPPQEDEANFQKYTYERITDQTYAEVLRNAKHRPTAALAELTSTLVDFKLNPLHQVEVEKVVTGLCDALGASERIFTSPVPTFYTRHTARFLAFWLMALPLGLYDQLKGWNHIGVIPVVILISGFLLGIEELATQMEEPFSILPMEKMCEGSIRTAVMEQVDRSKKGIQAQYYGEGNVASIATESSSYSYTPMPATGIPSSFPNGAPAPSYSKTIAIKSNGSLPENWESTIDPDSGNTYYYNTVTMQSTWDLPTE